MPHLVVPFENATYSEALQRLRLAHRHLVESAKAFVLTPGTDADHWGIDFKRSGVTLTVDERIGKEEESFGEIVNMTATMERLMDAVEWFSRHPLYEKCFVRECHPTTSDDKLSNDLVIADETGKVVARCEVCDVVGRSDSNDKEGDSLKKLKWDISVPVTDEAHYVCGSLTFKDRLMRRRRPTIPPCHYRYDWVATGSAAETYMLRILPALQSNGVSP